MPGWREVVSPEHRALIDARVEAQAALRNGVVHQLIDKPAQRDVLIASIATPQLP